MKETQGILIVSIAKLDNILIEIIEGQTGKKCIELYKYPRPARVSDLKRHIDCLMVAYKAFRLRNKYSDIIFWQQFIGLYYNVLCYLLLTREVPRAMVLTVIYIRRNGLLGNLYHLLFKKAFRSKYIDKLICHSSSERKYYLGQFGQDLTKRIVFCKLGEGLITENLNRPPQKKYFFSGGSSNRDYGTLINAFKELDEQLVIACKPENIDNYEIPSNVTVLHNAYGEGFTNLIKDAYSIILTISDPTISSGQLVLLNAMRYGKSSIVTGGNCMSDYIDKSYAIEIPANSTDDIKNAVTFLSANPELNHSMSENAYNCYCENYSIDKYAENIAGLIL
jgi:glycosyltransferase involved in cell wall biosynthesis